ncbi:peptidoglycan-associated lipoprotein Pal [Desulfohalobiaceae bacterium Ax17]|uniref:peptidoglycan-associated lipoprotein Pal n=1 Tax=Desulfovulcanus ferrireducens TaxID=2831190 RepID=UPI00207BAB47|nr:peptidoglycan-associated lipoprotein Pal [Desulfovulcanus ferrireducens]MBT8763864.1 peptidoglycan-associated lipoprotein Pal [Desulfovulcanus ferrireducens]
MRSKTLFLFVLATLSVFIISGCAKQKIGSVSPNGVVESTQKNRLSAEESRANAARKAREQALKERQLAEEQLAKEEAEKKKAIEQAVETISANKIYFDFDSFELKPEARAILQQKAELLKKYKNLRLVIEGHCDERGTEEYNLALGERRARAAYEFLILLGVESDRLQIVSYGEEFPADPGHNETAWAKNRRDEFKVLY